MSLPIDLGAEAAAELARAQSLFGSFNGPHEGWAVIFEELDELWDEVRASKPGSDRTKMRKPPDVGIIASLVRARTVMLPPEADQALIKARRSALM